jgi:hypothetical protein
MPSGCGCCVRIGSFSVSISAPLWKGRSGELGARRQQTAAGVYQIEAEDPEGHPWLMLCILAESTLRLSSADPLSRRRRRW